MKIQDALDRLSAHALMRRWDALEQHGRTLCTELSGAERAMRIGEVDLSGYSEALRDSIAKAAQSGPSGIKAIYFEYDLDNRWSGDFFLCGDYRPANEGDEDWATDWLKDFEGPAFEPFAELYGPTFDRTPRDMGNTVYLVARTVGAFGRACDGITFDGRAVCIAFHDQTPIMRIVERASPRL